MILGLQETELHVLILFFDVKKDDQFLETIKTPLELCYDW